MHGRFLSLLDASDRDLQAFLEKISESDRERIPEGSAWNVLEQLEHIFIVEKGALYALSEATGQTHELDEKFGNELLTRRLRSEEKWVAPDFVKPKGRFPDITAVKQAILRQRELLRSGLENGSIVIDRSCFPHPIIGSMPRSDWFYFLIQHTQRHMRQVERLL